LYLLKLASYFISLGFDRFLLSLLLFSSLLFSVCLSSIEVHKPQNWIKRRRLYTRNKISIIWREIWELLGLLGGNRQGGQ